MLAGKDQDQFVHQLFAYLGAFVVGIPFYVLRDYSRDLLAIRWRTWMTEQYMQRYFSDRTFYNIQVSRGWLETSNSDQHIVDDDSLHNETPDLIDDQNVQKSFKIGPFQTYVQPFSSVCSPRSPIADPDLRVEDDILNATRIRSL